MDKTFFDERTVHGTIDFPIAVYQFENEDTTQIALHYHTEFEFLILTKGSVNIQLDDITFTINENEGIFINSEVLHYAFCRQPSLCAFTAIVFSPKLIASEYDNMYRQFIRPIIENKISLPVKLSPYAIRLAFETVEIFKSAKPGYELAVKGSITRILALSIEKAQKIQNQNNDNKSEIVKKVLNYIHINYAADIALYDLSSQVHISKEHLCRIFKEISDVSPIVYLNRYRIMQSTLLLKNTNMNISEISAACGFNNSSYFNKLFMRFMNCTPSQYRLGLAPSKKIVL